jgi:glycerate kinase
MKILIAPDSFKESLPALEVAEYIARGAGKVFPEANIQKVPLSDGGEGLTDSLTAAMGGTLELCQVTGPLGERVAAVFGLAPDHTAIIEMAQASGLELVPRDQRNPMTATTFGTGELIKAALDKGCRTIIIGIGGSATNDGGAGMAQALGARLLDSSGQEIAWGGGGLLDLDRIDVSELDPRLAETTVLVACDVTNPLFGPYGASHIYGPQKGADQLMAETLDRALQHWAEVICRDLGVDVADIPGAGAAGGLGAGLLAFAGGKLQPGLELVMDALKMDDILGSGVDLVITGEGSINGQSMFGKVPVGLARRAKKYGVPVVVIVGSIGPGAEAVYAEGIDALISIAPGPITLEESLSRAGELIMESAQTALRLIRIGNKVYR